MFIAPTGRTLFLALPINKPHLVSYILMKDHTNSTLRSATFDWAPVSGLRVSGALAVILSDRY